MTELKQIVVERGVITFDGQVIEAFGFGRDPSQRVHVAFLDAIKLDEGGRFSDASVSFHSTKQVTLAGGTFTEEEFKSPELTDLLAAIRAAAPNLKEGS
jgi:hypothetical protein